MRLWLVNMCLWQAMCVWDPSKRPTAAQSLQHPFFQVKNMKAICPVILVM